MIKVGYGSDKVIVHLTRQEFNFLAGESYGNIDDGTDVSLVSVKNKLELIDAKEAELGELKTLCMAAYNKLNQIGI